MLRTLHLVHPFRYYILVCTFLMRSFLKLQWHFAISSVSAGAHYQHTLEQHCDDGRIEGLHDRLGGVVLRVTDLRLGEDLLLELHEGLLDLARLA